MNVTVSSGTRNRRADTSRPADVVTHMVQELLHVAATSNQRSGAALYLPETFLTRW